MESSVTPARNNSVARACLSGKRGSNRYTRTFVSTSAATDVEFLARPATRSRPHQWTCAFASSLPHRGPVEMSQPVPAQLRGVGYRAPVDLNRPAQGPQLQLIADPNSTSLDESLRKGDLKFAGHLRHQADHHTNQGYGQGFRLDSLAVHTTRGKRSRRGGLRPRCAPRSEIMLTWSRFPTRKVRHCGSVGHRLQTTSLIELPKRGPQLDWQHRTNHGRTTTALDY